MGHGSIETEHVLLALFDDQDGIAADVFAELGITSEQVRPLVAGAVGTGVRGGHRGAAVPFSPVAKKVLEVALREALSLGHEHIGPEHLLLAIVRVTEGGACQILAELGADTERVRALVIERLANLVPEPPVRRRPRMRREEVASVSFTAVPDAALARVLMGAAGTALSEQRVVFDIADVLRAALRDAETSSAPHRSRR